MQLPYGPKQRIFIEVRHASTPLAGQLLQGNFRAVWTVTVFVVALESWQSLHNAFQLNHLLTDTVLDESL